MNSVTLPPSPNWCLDNILVCANDGTVAWGSRNTIVIASPSPEDEQVLSYRFITNAHTDRVTSLAFSPEYGQENDYFLLSGGDDNVVKIWNLKDLTISHANSALEEKYKIVAVDWFKSDSKGICYISEEGQLVYWNIFYHLNWIIKLGKMTATCLSCCPHDPYTVAVGSKYGLVYVVDSRRSGSIIYKLSAHNSQIVSLSWCPVPTNVFNETNKRDLLLATGAKDRSIYIWRAGGDGRQETTINVPTGAFDSNAPKQKFGSNDRNWIALNWVEPKTLLSSSAWGELVSWNLAMVKGKQQAHQAIHTYHGKGLFCIATVPINFEQEETNWRSKNSIIVWTLAQDRQIICHELKEGTNNLKYMIQTQGGFVYCMAACPLDTSQIAFGAGDKMLRLWNLSEPHKNNINVTMIWQKIMGKVRSIAWHPEKENLLVFGTEEGRVGLVDTNTSRPPTLFSQYHRNVVYSIAWGPVPNKSTYELYSNSIGELVYYDSDKPEKDPVVMPLSGCTAFAWKPDYSYMVVGFEDGFIKFYNKDHKQINTAVRLFAKAIYCMAWHPESTVSDVALSSMKNYLAIAGDSTNVTVTDISEMNSSSTADNPSDKNITSFYKIVANLKGHVEKVVTLAWNPFITGQLLTGSYDGTIQIWKVETEQIMKTFNDHNGSVLCCMWSPLDPDYVLSGSVDFTLRVWKVSDQDIKLPTPKPKRPKSKKNKNKLKVQIIQMPEENVKENNSVAGPQVIAEANGNDLQSEIAFVREEARLNKEQKKINKLDYWEHYQKKIQNRDVISASIRGMLKETNGEKEDDENEIRNSDDDENYSLFQNKSTTVRIVDEELKELRKKKYYKPAMELDVWRNQLKENVDAAIKENRLNDYLVSLTPSLSFKTWQETCMIYAMQLVMEGDHKKAVTYMLNISKIHEAIGIYMDAKMYKEAYLLATCRLDPQDPLLTQILQDWATYSFSRGKYEEAVQCFTKLGDYALAAKILSRRESHLPYLELAVELAVASKQNDLIETLAELTMTKALLYANYELAQSLVERFPPVFYMELQLKICMKISENSKTVPNSMSVYQQIIEGNKFGLIEYFEHLYGPEKLALFYAQLNAKNFAVDVTDDKSLWTAASHHLSLAIATDSKEIRLKHIVSALGLISNFELTNCKANSQKNYLLSVLSTLSNKSLLDETNFFNDHEFESSKSLRAYLCLAILSWFARAEDAVGYIDKIAQVMEKYITDVFDQKTVNYWTMNTKIDKIENELSISMGKVQTNEQDSDVNNKETVQQLIEKLDEMKLEKKEFTDLRVCAPNPVVVYCAALEFGSKIFDKDKAQRFSGPITELWNGLQI